jgi:hypothetical protein
LVRSLAAATNANHGENAKPPKQLGDKKNLQFNQFGGGYQIIVEGNYYKGRDQNFFLA